MINTGTFGVTPKTRGKPPRPSPSARCFGGSVGTALLNTIFAAAVTSYIAAHLAAAQIIGRQALAGLALAHGYDTAFWSIAGIFAGGAIIGGVLLRRGPLRQKRTLSPASGAVPMTQAGASSGRAR
jgi:hypothetical protein